MKTIVFVGPTLRDVTLAGAEVRPPAGVGDVLRASRERVQRIAIIDGYFERMAAVWHKEILVALDRGIEVWGAASMGALRAAELDVFGMRGVGTIYRAFKRGELVRDDEVAVAHLPGEVGYRPVSDALVNLRDGLAR
ncbi:MAG TPA: TfuA domain-containing protein, partial [Kofleriaceae bacterium]|nr:TfuA domain-containing protein [Kofleriaceae bacterium]